MRVAITSTAATPSLDDLMDQRTIPALARTAVLETLRTVRQRGVSVEARASQGHLSLRAVGKGVAVFVYPRRFSLTFDRPVAVEIAARYEICDLQQELSNKTGHIRIAHDRLRDPRWSGIINGLLAEALERSAEPAAARTSVRRPAAPPVAPATPQCPVHQQAMFGGYCYLCD